MNVSKTTLALTALAAIIVGLLVGFIPEHMANSSLEQQVQSVKDGNSSLQGHLSQTENQLTLSNFAVRSANVLVDANRNNYSVASSGASSLFTDMRKYVDSSGDQAASAQLAQVLAARDRTIAGLAQADPGVKQVLLEIFEKIQGVSTQALQAK